MRDLGVVGIEPGVLVAGRADELRRRRIVRTAAHPFGREAGSRHRPCGDLCEFGEQFHRQGLGRHHPIVGCVIDHRAVGADRHRCEAQFLHHRWNPSGRSPGGQHEYRTARDRCLHRFTGAGGDAVLMVQQRAVDVAGDHRREHQGSSGGPPSRSLRFSARSANSAASSSAACAGVGAPPPRRCGTQNSPDGCGP